jgi:hypothetical protein
MAKKTTNKQTQYQNQQSNILQFDRVKRTKTGYAIFIGRNVLFLKDALISFIDKNQKKAA